MCVASSISRRMESKVYIGNKDFFWIFGETRFNGPEYQVPEDNKKFGFLFFYPIRRYVDISPYFASHLISSTQCCPVVCVP